MEKDKEKIGRVVGLRNGGGGLFYVYNPENPPLAARGFFVYAHNYNIPRDVVTVITVNIWINIFRNCNLKWITYLSIFFITWIISPGLNLKGIGFI